MIEPTCRVHVVRGSRHDILERFPEINDVVTPARRLSKAIQAARCGHSRLCALFRARTVYRSRTIRDVIRSLQKDGVDRQSKRRDHLPVDHEFKPHGLLDRKIGRFRTVKNPRNVSAVRTDSKRQGSKPNENAASSRRRFRPLLHTSGGVLHKTGTLLTVFGERSARTKTSFLSKAL